MKLFLTLLITVLFLIIAFLLGLKNQQIVTFNFLIAQNELRLSTLLAIIFAVGFSTAMCLSGYFHLILKMKNRKLKKLTVVQQRELNDLRVSNKKA